MNALDAVSMKSNSIEFLMFELISLMIYESDDTRLVDLGKKVLLNL